MDLATVASPCTGVCRIDLHTGWCAGCLRTLDEIAAWPRLDDAARRALWQQLEQRRSQQPPGATPAPRQELP